MAGKTLLCERGLTSGNRREQSTCKEEADMGKIEVLTHSSIRLCDAERTIYIDPFRMKGAPHDADYILITHDHYDHFSPEDIRKAAKSGTVLVVPEKMKKAAQEFSAGEFPVYTVSPGEKITVSHLKAEAVPAYNKLKPFHPKRAGWVGYIIETDLGRVYVAGDTDKTRDNLQVKCDIALVPVGGTYTMDAKEAAELINEIRPKTAIPTHYGSIVGKKEDADAFAALVKEPVKTEILMKE